MPGQRRIQWSFPVVQGIVKAAHDYASGLNVRTRMGEAFKIQVGPIIDVETYSKITVGDWEKSK